MFEVKSLLAKLLATEDVNVLQNPAAQTASFDVKNRVLTLPVWEKISEELNDMLVVHEVGHALDTPPDGWVNAIKDIAQRKNPGDGNLWTFRRIAARRNFVPGAYASDICLVNWPMLDYFEAPIIDVPEAVYNERLAKAAELSMSVFYWLQTEAPREDGGQGFPGLRLRSSAAAPAGT